jgi:hypothetical protein
MSLSFLEGCHQVQDTQFCSQYLEVSSHKVSYALSSNSPLKVYQRQKYASSPLGPQLSTAGPSILCCLPYVWKDIKDNSFRPDSLQCLQHLAHKLVLSPRARASDSGCSSMSRLLSHPQTQTNCQRSRPPQLLHHYPYLYRA